jgi:hypothetical protein
MCQEAFAHRVAGEARAAGQDDLYLLTTRKSEEAYYERVERVDQCIDLQVAQAISGAAG